VVVVVDVVVVVGLVVDEVTDVVAVVLGADPAIVVDVDAGGGVVAGAVVVVLAAVVAGSAGVAGAGTSSAESGWMGSPATWAPASCTAPMPTPTASAVASTHAAKIAVRFTSPLSQPAAYRRPKGRLSSC
jgi:hypothetical protein